MSFYKKLSITLIVIIMLSLPLMTACDDDETTEPPTAPVTEPTAPVAEPTAPVAEPTAPVAEPTAPVTEPVVEDVKVTIGNLTDTTGPASFAMSVVDTALKDIIRYANEENLIPGIEIVIKEYDTAYNPANDIPGYEFLKEKGADFIVAGLPNIPISLQSRLNDDQMVLIAMSADEVALSPPGYTFMLNSATGDKTKTLLKWIAENDWDYETNGPAKIGIVAWGTSYFTEQEIAGREYADEHPEQFEWEGSYFTGIVFEFTSEVSETKDFDYILPPGAALTQFTEQYRQGGGKAKFLMTDAHHPGLGRIRDAGIWDMIDGSYFIIPHRWWNEDAEVSNLAKQLLVEYHGEGQLDTYMQEGGAYVGSFHMLYSIIDIIKATVENVGAENFSTEALYETLQEFSTDFGDAYEPWGYSATDRFGTGYEAVYIADSSTQDLVRVDEEWFPLTK